MIKNKFQPCVNSILQKAVSGSDSPGRFWQSRAAHTQTHAHKVNTFVSLVNRCRKSTPTLTHGASGSNSAHRGVRRGGCGHKHCFAILQHFNQPAESASACVRTMGAHAASLNQSCSSLAECCASSCDVVCVGRFHSEGMCTDLRKFIDGPSSYLSLPDELKSAMEAITYIAEALQAEKDYEAVNPLISDSLVIFFFCHVSICHWFSIFMCFFPFPFPSSISSIRPLPAEGGLAVRCHGGGPHVPVDLCHFHHRGHLGHLCRRQLQPHTNRPLQILEKQRDNSFITCATYVPSSSYSTGKWSCIFQSMVCWVCSKSHGSVLNTLTYVHMKVCQNAVHSTHTENGPNIGFALICAY